MAAVPIIIIIIKKRNIIKIIVRITWITPKDDPLLIDLALIKLIKKPTTKALQKKTGKKSMRTYLKDRNNRKSIIVTGKAIKQVKIAVVKLPPKNRVFFKCFFIL